MGLGNRVATLREFELVFKRLYVPLGMFAIRFVDNADDAEDIVQDAFVKTWQQLQSGIEIANIKAYLYIAVRNACVVFLNHRSQSAGLDELSDQVSAEAIDTSERDARIWETIDRLPDRCREIFLMSKRDGMTNEEISQELNLSIQTVKNQITKAFKNLREALSDGHKPFFLPFL